MPDDPGDPFTGTLQAMRVVGQDNVNTSVGLGIGDTLDIEWIVYFSATNGGPFGLGQIFRLVDGPASGTLELFAQSEDFDVLDFPDNITVAPWGQLFIAEDGFAGDQFIRAITDKGEIIPFARNAASTSEFAGVCFSPDGRALFVNIQGDGLTLVVTGPFPDLPGSGDDTGTGIGDDTGMDVSGTSGSSEGDSATAGSSGAGSSEGGGVTSDDPSGSGESTGGAGGQDDGGGGCGCQSGGSPASGAAALVGAVALGVRARRRIPDSG